MRPQPGQLLEVIYPVWQNARIWGAVHPIGRTVCATCATKLDDPATRRSSLKQALIALAKEVEEQGPPEESTYQSISI
jgi:hypothetical protein